MSASCENSASFVAANDEHLSAELQQRKESPGLGASSECSSSTARHSALHSSTSSSTNSKQQAEQRMSSSNGYQEAAAGAAAAVGPDDVITLNVGGRLFSCLRRTLCLVEESLLALMFGGRWPCGLVTDSQGHAFLDLDPELFEVVLNWLRQYNIYRGGNIHEPHVPHEKTVHMVAMLDYLQLHRHIPLMYHETFAAEQRSPFMLVNDATATRTAVAAQHPGKHAARGGKTLMQFAVSDHSYFDIVVDIQLEVLRFHDTTEELRSSHYMFLGFVHQAAAAALDPAGDINTQLTKSASCYGWLVNNELSFTVHHGQRSQVACLTSHLWRQGDMLTLTLDTRRDQAHATITCLNTVSGLSKSINAGHTSTSTSSSSSSSKPDKKKSRPGLRHRLRAMPLPPESPDREEILAILRRQPYAMGANARVDELVIAAALQVLEAQGFGVNESLSILRRPGLVQRLVQQVVNVTAEQGLVQGARHGAAGAGANHAAAAAAVGDAAAPPPPLAAAAAHAENTGPSEQQQPPSNGLQPQQSESQRQEAGQGAATAAATLGSAKDRRLPDGLLLPASTADYDWVLVVGLVHPADSVRIVSVKRRGMAPGQ